MNHIINLLTQVYSALLHLYPSQFRAEFGDELRAVFCDATNDAAKQGMRELVRVFCRELRDVPFAALDAHLRQRRKSAMENKALDIPVTRTEILIGIGFFLFYPLGFLLVLTVLYIFGNPPAPENIGIIISSTIVLAMLGGIIAILVVGWIRGFPRWCYPYWMSLIAISLALTNAATPGLWVFGYTMSGQELWGWRAWIPMAIVFATSVFFTRSFRPLFKGIVDLWNDWTRLSFGLYAFLPFLLLIMFDEVHGEDPFVAMLWCILAIGALGYMRAKNNLLRMIALLTSAIFCLSASTVYLAFYWHGRQEFWMPYPGDGWLNAQSHIYASMNYIALLLSPILLGIVRGTINRLRPA